jgi:hypothetical protein
VKVEAAAENPAACRLLQALLERYLSSGEKARPIRLDDKRIPEFGPLGRPGEADEAWEAIQSLTQAGVLRIDPFKIRPGKAPYEMQPLVRLADGQVERAAALIGFRLDGDPWTKEWMAVCDEAEWIPADLRKSLSSRPHRIADRTPREVLERWKRLIDPKLKAVYIREASAASFWGLSKALDERLVLVNQVRHTAGLLALIEPPILVNVHLAPGGLDRGVLFIENQSTFDACRRGRVAAAVGLSLVYSSGFRASAARLRNSDTASLYPSAESAPSEMQAFRAWFFSADDACTYFWGDLDHAALAILRALRVLFPAMESWEPGYRALLNLLLQGEGHLPHEDPRKGEQRDVVTTGCRFADNELLPALRACGRFVDQEATLP